VIDPSARILSIPSQRWFEVGVSTPSILRPAGNSTQQPAGELFAFWGATPPPELPSAAAFPGISSVGFGVLSLNVEGRWWVYYGGLAPLSVSLEPLAGREPPSVESGSGFFFRRGTFNTPITAGTSATVFGANPRRKKLNLNLPEGGAVYIRYDGGTPTVTNFDLFFEGSIIQSIQLTGDDVPPGQIVALNNAGVDALLVATEWN
jgi:hypothetical protein